MTARFFGIEPGAAYREFARGKGLEVYEDLNQIAAKEEDRFDLVSMIHVLEHIPDPVGFLIRLREEFLTINARILIEVPNLYAHDCFEVAHLTSFSRETLIQVLKKAGYGTVFIERHGYPRSKLIPIYITLLAEPAEVRSDQLRIDLERWVRVKRRADFCTAGLLNGLFQTTAGSRNIVPENAINIEIMEIRF